MKPHVLTLFALLIFSVVFGQQKYSQVKIYVPLKDVPQLQKAGLEFDHSIYNDEENSLTTTLSEGDIRRLKKLSVKYHVLVEDETAEFLRKNQGRDFYRFAHEGISGSPAQLNARLAFESSCSSNRLLYAVPQNFTEGSMGGYYTLSELMGKIDQLKAAYPSLVDTFSLPSLTWQGRRIKVVKISDNASADEDEPEALFGSLIHAREPNSMMSLLFFMQYMLENYNRNPQVAQVLNSRELFFIPCINPDGYLENQRTNPAGGGFRRKNMRNTGSGNFGVDLNRNFAVGFGFDNTGSSPVTTSDTYRGPSAFSEPETQALRDFVATRNFTIGVTCHAFGNYHIIPYGADAIGTLTPEENAVFSNMPTLLTKYNFYKAGTGLETVNYTVNGVSDDWFLAGGNGCSLCGPVRPKVYGYTPEVGTAFWPSKDSIIPIGREMVFTHYQTACIAGAYYDVQDTDNATITAANGTATCLVRRWGVQQKNATLSLIPLQNVATVGAPVTLNGNSFTNFNSSQNSTIAYTLNNGLTNGSVVKYIWRITSDGLTVEDTVTKIFNAAVVFSDDMEQGSITDVTSKWTTTGNWGFTTSSAFSGSRSLTESPNGNYAANTDNTVTLKNAVDLSGGKLVLLSYFTRHLSENGFDRVTVEISTNGVGSGANWTPLCGRLTVSEPKGTIANTPSLTGNRRGWVRELIDLSNYNNSTNVGIRFRFRSNSNSIVGDGFYFDDVTIVKSGPGAPPPACATPVNLTTTAITTGGATLNWTVVSGAIGYNVEYKTTSATTWINVATAIATTSFNLTGLTAATNYNWRVRANCSNNNSNFSESGFTTLTPGGGGGSNCVTAFEPNESRATAATINIGGVDTAAITTTADNDYFKITTTRRGTIVFTLAGVPGKDYDMSAFNSNGNRIGLSETPTPNETITLNNRPAGTYFVRVYGYNGANSNSCYTIKVSTATSAKQINNDLFTLSPNPGNGNFTIKLYDQVEEDIRLFSSSGQLVKTIPVNGRNFIPVSSGLQPGVYLIRVMGKDKKPLSQKLIIQQ
jgi:hypothetical protein